MKRELLHFAFNAGLRLKLDYHASIGSEQDYLVTSYCPGSYHHRIEVHTRCNHIRS